jgi:hypothetical protein
MKRVTVAAGAIGATMVMMTVIGPRGVIVPTTTVIDRHVVYAMTCQLPGLMTKTALLARTSEARRRASTNAIGPAKGPGTASTRRGIRKWQ